MTQLACVQCGGQNAPGASVCSSCGYDLGDSASTTVVHLPVAPAPGAADPDPGALDGAAPGPDGPRHAGLARPPRVSVVDPEVVLDGAEGGGFDLRVVNPSSIVEGYRLDAVEPPPWLVISQPTIRLLPDAHTVARIELAVRPGSVAVAQRIRLPLRVRLLTDEAVYAEVDVMLTVPEVGGPAAVRTEPAVVRLRDTPRGRFTVVLDNEGCNHPERYQLSGYDDEAVVRFTFAPPAVELAPGGSAEVDVQFESPAPSPGEISTRQLKVRATSDRATVEAVVGLIHQSSAAPSDAPVRVRLEPAVPRTLDSSVVELDVVVDNRAGARIRRVVLGGRDPEDRIRFAFRSPEVEVRPGAEVRTRARLQAPVPAPGEEVTRQFTVTALDGRHESEGSGSWVQAASSAPITTATVRLEPEHLRLRDHPVGRFGVVVDNGRGVRPLRVRLSGSDPEGIVGFAFGPPYLEVGPGRSARAELTVSAPLPPPGQEAARKLRVRAADEFGAVEATGVFDQSTSPTPLSTARILLEPQHLVAGSSRRGRLLVQLDNKRGATWLRARLTGSDPERAVRFDFTPAVLDVPPGQVGWATVTLSAPRPDSGTELTRPIRITADDGASAIEATGSFAQSTGELRPKLRVLLTLLGAFLVAVSAAFLPWLIGDEDSGLLPTGPNIASSIAGIGSTSPPGSAADVGELVRALQPLERSATLLMAALMVFGLTGVSGRLTRLTALLVTVTMVVVSVFYSIVGTGTIGIGSIVVVLGGIIAFAGGLCVKR